MIPLAEVAALQAADAAAAERGIAGADLMRRAGAAVAVAAQDLLGGTAGRRVVAVAGKGHNGGDAMLALVPLARRGAGVVALLGGDPATLTGELDGCAAAVRAAGGAVLALADPNGSRHLSDAEVVLDGVLGTGTIGAPRGAAATAIEAICAAGAPVVAVDIASGVDGATGAVPGPAVTAEITVSFQAAKPGHLLPPGSANCGRLVVADIGLPLKPTGWGVSEAADVAPLLPIAEHESQKRARGVLLLIAGSAGMAGAATLAALAASRSGTGLLVVATPESVSDRVGAAVPSALTVRLPERDAGIGPEALPVLERWLGEARAIAIGPGLGRAPATVDLVRHLVGGAGAPMVVDADGLFALGAPHGPGWHGAPVLLTPHEGEFARLAGDDAALASGTRLHKAGAAAQGWDATVLLKGNNTVIADADGRLAVNPTGTPVLATGGTGDVLTGVSGALLAQRLAAFDAARLAAWVHGRAGRLAAAAGSPVSVSASDVADALPAAFAELC